MAVLTRDQLLPLIQKYLPGDPNKWLHVIQHESGGNPSASGDGGSSIGLFQDQHIPQGATVEQQFASAAKLYNADIKNGGTGFGDWGEGRLYKGKPFGSLGNNPYPGGSTVTTPTRAPASGGTDPESIRIRKELSDRLNEAFATEAAAGTTAQKQLAALAVTNAIKDLAAWDAAKGNNSILPDKQAQDAFDNALKLKDFGLRAAQQGYTQYASKATMARDAASAELADIEGKNKAAGSGPSSGQRFDLEKKSGVLAGGYGIPSSYEDALGKWTKMFGADGGPPDPNAIDSGASGGNGGGEVPPADMPVPPSDPMRPTLDTMMGDGTKPQTTDPTAATWTPGNPWQTGYEPPYRPPTTDQAAADATLPPARTPGDPFARPDNPAVANWWKNKPGILKFGRGTANAPGGAAMVNDRPKGGSSKAAWWQQMNAPAAWKKGIPGVLSHATGTNSHPGGPAMLNDGGGAETILPPGGAPFQLPGGPQVTDLPQGSAVIPANVPPEEAMRFMQLKQAAGAPTADPNSPEAQAMRANDPQLQLKVLESLKRAIVNEMAAHPPPTPTYTGTRPDPWKHLRPLTQVPADPAMAQEMAAAAAKGGR